MTIKAKFTPPSHNWAQTSGIDKPFIYIPCWDGAGTNLANYGNVGPTNFTVVKPNNDPWGTVGFFDGDGDAGANPDTTYAYDGGPTTNLNTMMNFYNGATNGVGGKTLLICASIIAGDSSGGSSFIHYGSESDSGGTGHGWRLAFTNTGLNFRVRVGATLANTAIVTWSSSLSQTAESKIVIFLDASTAGITVYLDNVAQTPTNLSTATASMDSNSSISGQVTLFSNAVGDTAAASPNTMVGSCRNLLIVGGVESADVERIAQEYQQAPNYTVPRFLGTL